MRSTVVGFFVLAISGECRHREETAERKRRRGETSVEETRGANASEEEGERENDSSSIYISSHSRLPETGAFPSKPGIGTKQMSFGKRMKTSLFLAASGLAHYGGRIVDRDLFSLGPDAKPASTCPSDKFPESWSLFGCSCRAQRWMLYG